MPTVAIFRDWLLPISETFIRAQIDALTRFEGVYVGCIRAHGLEISGHPAVLMRPGFLGRAERLLLGEFGAAPILTPDLRRRQPRLIHAHFGPDGVLAMPLARALGIPLVVTFHGYDATVKDATHNKTRSGRWYVKRRGQLKANVTTILAVSRFIAGKLFEQGFPPEKVQVHYIGVDTEQFKPQCDSAPERKVLFVGRLVENKGCEYLIRAMEPLQKEMPDVELMIVGDGPLRDSLESMAKTRLRRFTFMGGQPPEIVRDLMSRAAILCTPSVTTESGNEEGFGIVFIEAQASGLPVVSFASGGIPEAVKHGETGYLAPEKDWRTMSKYIASLLTDPYRWEQFSRAGRSFVEREFDLKVQTGKLEEIYQQVILATELVTSGKKNAAYESQPGGILQQRRVRKI
jgi:colanic acid/amylovoran biosynthesis glycosyltransferase